MELANLEKRIKEMNFNLKITEEAVKFLGVQGYDETYGARPLGRAIQHYVEDVIADDILGGLINEGDTINVDFDTEKGEIVIKGIKTKTK